MTSGSSVITARPDRLGLERDARAGRRGDAELAGIARADRRADRGDLILRLEGGDAEFLEAREVVEDRRCRGDRIAAEEHLEARQLRAGDQPERQRFRAGDRAIEAGLGRRRGDMVLVDLPADLDRLAIGMAGVQRGDIGLGQLGRLGELGLEPVDDRLAVAVEHPQRQAQRPHILAAQRFLVAEAERLHRIERQLRDVEVDQLPLGEAAVLERVGVIARLGEVARRELALVGDDQPAFAKRR